jgi:uncharacterized protein (DUF983 family)
MKSKDPAYPPISPLRTGLRGYCPRCGKGRLFAGYLQLAPRCEVCGLDFTFIDSADGPAFFVMTLVAFTVVGGAFVVEVRHQPPLWVHVLLWLPLSFALSLLLLRPFKGVLVALQYHYRAEEGRRASDEP